MSFKQAELWEAIQQPQAIRSETVPLMEEVAKRYPYFQLLHTLIAKAKHDRQTPDAYDALGKAAIYAPSRRLLRQVFYDQTVNETISGADAPPTPPENSAEVVASPPPEVPTEPQTENTTNEQSLETGPEPDEAPTVEEHAPDQRAEEEPDSLRDELAKSLEDLRVSKDQSAEELAEIEQHSEQTAEERSDGETTITDSATDTTDEALGEPSDETDSTSLRDDLVKTLEDLRASKGQATTQQADAEEPAGSAPVTPPRTHQQKIIDRFVSANPQINRDAPSAEKNASDLSATSSAFQDDLVTENLAEIMLKQGKTDKAVNLYEKLMVKYPEKKAYFAQKIEQLKNT
ncbi:MAG: hypothetical protein WA958_06470 [Tunicatimonas sp.]